MELYDTLRKRKGRKGNNGITGKIQGGGVMRDSVGAWKLKRFKIDMVIRLNEISKVK